MPSILILMPVGQELILCEFTGSAASNPLPQMPISNQRKSDAIRRPKADLNLVDGPIQESTRQLSVIWLRRQVFAHLPARREGTPKMFHIVPVLDSEYTFVDATFSKRVFASPAF